MSGRLCPRGLPTASGRLPGGPHCVVPPTSSPALSPLSRPAPQLRGSYLRGGLHGQRGQRLRLLARGVAEGADGGDDAGGCSSRRFGFAWGRAEETGWRDAAG